MGGMNIAEQMDLAYLPIWIVDPYAVPPSTMAPGRLIPVRRIDSVRIVGGNPPVWERARRVIEQDQDRLIPHCPDSVDRARDGV
jgi:hypothetical protein